MKTMQRIASATLLALLAVSPCRGVSAEQADVRITIPVKALLYYPVLAAK